MFGKILSFVELVKCYVLTTAKRYLNTNPPSCNVIDRNMYELSFVHNSVTYRFRFPRKRRPCNVVKVVDCENGQDVTTEFLQFMGPSHDFYGATVTPKFLGFGDIVILFKGNKSAVFAKECPIAF